MTYKVKPHFFSPAVNDDDFFDLYLNLTTEELVSIAHKPNQFILKCSFQGTMYPGDQCSKLKNDGGYAIAFTPRFGVCYTWNTNNTLDKASKIQLAKSMGPGMSNGLTLLLQADGEFYMNNLRTERNGALLAIHGNDQLGNMESNAIYLSPNTETNIALSKISFHRLEYPYESHCIRDFPPGIANPAGIQPGYSHQSCQAASLAMRILKKCGCLETIGTSVTGSMHYIFSPNVFKQCKSNDKECIMGVYQSVEMDNFTDPIWDNCHLKCEEDKYQVEEVQIEEDYINVTIYNEPYFSVFNYVH